jgi:hypothetical protein
VSKHSESSHELAALSAEVLAELMRRVQDIDNSYRAVAQKMGQLYMRADEYKVASLTLALDKPMRNASDNEQTFAAILEQLQLQASQHR